MDGVVLVVGADCLEEGGFARGGDCHRDEDQDALGFVRALGVGVLVGGV